MRYITVVLLAIATLLLAGVFSQPAQADLSFDVAYSNLSQHGSWLVSTEYGRVWQPRDYNREWNPYYDGHWVYTDLGWTWVSDYEWGAIPYHYGTWILDRRAGWVWIPGSVWAPSWVVFRTGSDCIGWAPVPPSYSVGMSINVDGPSSFVFVSSRDFLAPRVRTSIITRDRVNVIINKTTVVNNTIVIQNNVVINRGPDFKFVEKATGRTIRQERIENVARVAPFAHVDRAQLAVNPEHAKRGLRVAQQVSADRPLPGVEKRGSDDRTSPSTEASRPRNRRPADRSATRESATRSAPATRPSDSRQVERRTPEVKKQADPQKTAKARPNEKPKADAQQAEQARPDEPKADPQQADKARPDERPKADGKQNAKGQPKAKAGAGARAKKDNPEKKGQGSDKADEAKDGAHQ